MTPTIFAAYSDAGQAVQALSALVQRGVSPSHLSLVAHRQDQDDYLHNQSPPVANLSATVQKENEREAAKDMEQIPGGVVQPSIVSVQKTVAASAGLGIGVGALAAVTAIVLPGYGLFVGGGALAAAAAGLAASSKKGVVADSIVGWLKDQGVPATEIGPMREAYEQGGAVVGVSLEESPADRVELESILRSFDATSIGWSD